MSLSKLSRARISLVFVLASLIIAWGTLSFWPAPEIDYFDVYNLSQEVSPWHNGQNVRVAGWLTSAFLVIASVLLWPRVISRKWVLLLSLGLSALAIRIVLAFTFYGTYDVASYELVVDLFNEGKIVYAETSRYNYSPLWMFFLVGIDRVSKGTGLPFPGLVKLPASICDLLLGMLLYKWAEKQGLPEDLQLSAMLWYLFNPISVLISAYHGQFGAFWLLFAFSAWCHTAVFPSRHRVSLPSLLIGVGILVKTVPIVQLPAYLLRVKKLSEAVKFLFLSLSLVVIATLPYFLSAPGGVMRNAVMYRSEYGLWGWAFLLGRLMKLEPFEAMRRLEPLLRAYGQLPLLAMLVFVVVSTKHAPLLKSLTLTILTIYVFSSGFALQYLIWVLPFGIALRDPMVRWYTLFGTLWLVIGYGFPFWAPLLSGGLKESLSQWQFLRWAGIPAYLMSAYWACRLYWFSVCVLKPDLEAGL